MSININSVLTTCLLDSFIILIICVLAHRNKMIQKAGPSCMIALLLASMIRMCFPVELWYTHSLWIEEILQPVLRVLFHIVYSETVEITVADILLFIWFVGAVINLVASLVSYLKLKRYVTILPKANWEDILAKYHLKKEDYKGIENVMVVYSPHIQSPCVAGMRNPYVLLPKIDYSAVQFQYILMHEMMHIKKKDIWWKALIDFICMIFWWNPVFRYVKKELFQLIEIRNDIEIVGRLSDQEVVEYMATLKDTAVQMSGKQTVCSALFNQSGKAALKRRLKLIGEASHFYRGWQAVLCVLVIVMLFFSSTFVIVPVSFETIKDEGIPLTSQNTFLVINGDCYDVYIYGEYTITLDSTEGFHDVKIYKSLEEALANE